MIEFCQSILNAEGSLPAPLLTLHNKGVGVRRVMELKKKHAHEYYCELYSLSPLSTPTGQVNAGQITVNCALLSILCLLIPHARHKN